jgi:hypothetical protein
MTIIPEEGTRKETWIEQGHDLEDYYYFECEHHYYPILKPAGL